MTAIIKTAQLVALLLILLLPACGEQTSQRQEEGALKKRLKGQVLAKRLVLSPQPPLSESPITAVIEGVEIGKKNYVYKWEKNGKAIANEASQTLDKIHFKRGDVIKASVAVNSGNEILTTEPAAIENSPPKITSVRLEPNAPKKGDTLKALVEGFDEDSDKITFIYSWSKGGKEIGKEPSFSAASLSKGERINLEITPSDGQAKGKSAVITTIIVNSPPTIISNPSPAKGNAYSYQVVVNDPDRDKIAYKLIQGPSGMELEPNTGLLRWNFTEKDSGEHSIEIKASDPNGAESVQKFNLTIGFKK